METKFTKGPWSGFPNSSGDIGAYELSVLRRFEITVLKGIIATIKPDGGIGDIETIGNTLLIKAAPNLFKACLTALDALGADRTSMDREHASRVINDAVKKAMEASSE